MNTPLKYPFRGQGFTISITISGKVQGVYFRQSTKEKAKELGLTGQVKNLPDGSVHITATGTKEQLDKLEAWCRKGPSRAVVDNIIIKKLPLQQFEQFNIVR
jgi:acylphosphatase